MPAPDKQEFKPENLTTEAMLGDLHAHGWEYSENTSVDGIEIAYFVRSYPRVNQALQGDSWRGVVGSFPSFLDERLPDLPRAIGMTTSGGDTEVTVEISGSNTDRDEVVKAYALDNFLREAGFEEADEQLLADWFTLKGSADAPRMGSREFYEQQPRAAKLRNLCIDLISNYRDVVVFEGTEGEAMERLLELNHKLAEMAVDPKMHNGAKPVEFADPTVRVECIAGALRQALQDGKGFSGRAKELIEEHDLAAGELEGVKMPLLNSGSAVSDATNVLAELYMLEKGVDAEAGLTPDRA